jgi:hypothetical protein
MTIDFEPDAPTATATIDFEPDNATPAAVIDFEEVQPDRSFGSALKYGIDQPLENLGITAEVLGQPEFGAALKNIVKAPENYESAASRFVKPQEGDFTLLGFAPAQIPRAIVEQFGQAAGSLISRVAGGLAGGFIAGGAGAAATSPTGPGAIVGGGVAAAPGVVAGQFIGPFLFGALQTIGPVARERARRNGRTEPTGEDIAASLTTAAASGALDSIGAQYLPGGKAVMGPVMERIIKGFTGEFLTETAQSVTEQFGQSVATKHGLEIDPREAVGEGVIGGGNSAASVAITAPLLKSEAPKTAAAVESTIPRTQPVTVTVPEVVPPPLPSGSLGPPDPLPQVFEKPPLPVFEKPPKPFAPIVQGPVTAAQYGRETDVYDAFAGLERPSITPQTDAAVAAAAPAQPAPAAIADTAPRPAATVAGAEPTQQQYDAMVAADRVKNLKRLKKERKDLIAQYGNQGQKHPLGRMIGGLNPAAVKLQSIRGQIAELERLIRGTKPEKPVMTPIVGTNAKREMGLLYNVKFGDRTGKIGKSNLGKWYAVENGEIVTQDYRTAAEARDAWAKSAKPTPAAPAAPVAAPVAKAVEVVKEPTFRLEQYGNVWAIVAKDHDTGGTARIKTLGGIYTDEHMANAQKMVDEMNAMSGQPLAKQPAKTAPAAPAAPVAAPAPQATFFRRELSKDSDPNYHNDVLRRWAQKAKSDAELSEVLDRVEPLEASIGSNAWGTANDVVENKNASEKTKARALAMREEWMRPGRDEAPAPPATPAAPEPAPAPARVQLRSGPATYTVEEQLAPQKGDQPGEVYFRVKNERTGEEQTVEAADMKPVKAKAKVKPSKSKLNAGESGTQGGVAVGSRLAPSASSSAPVVPVKAASGDVIDSALSSAIDALKTPKGKLLVDPLLLRTVGAPALRAALIVVRSAYRAGKTVAQAIEAGLQKLRETGKKFDEQKARDYFSTKGISPDNPLPGESVKDGREGEYYTRVAERDKGTLSDNAWSVVRNRTTLPDSFREDIDEAAKILLQTNDGDLRSALDRSKEMSASGWRDRLSGLTDRRKAALLFLISQNAATQRETATDPKQIRALMDVEAGAIADFSDMMSQGGKLLNIAGQLYAAMPMSPDAKVMAAEKLLARMTGGKAAEVEAEKVSTEVKKRVRKVTDKALEDASKESSDKEESINQRAANSILNRYSKIQSDTPTWDKSLDENPVRKAFREQVEKPKPIKEFVAILKGLDVDSRTAEVLFYVADRETRSRKAVQMAKDSSKLSDEEKSALRIIERQAKQDSDTPGWPKATEDPVFLLFASEARIGRRTEADFMQAAMALGVSERKAKQLYDAAKRENRNIEVARKQAGVRDALDAEISSVIREAGISIRNIILNKRKSSWGEVVEQLAAAIQSAIPDVSAARAEEMASRIRERLEKLFNAERANMLATEANRGKKGNRSALDKLWKLFEMGALDDETMTKVFMEKAGVQEFTPAFRDKLKKMYEDAEAAPEGMPRERILGNIAVELAMANPKTFGFWWNLAMSISYGNILGAFTTIFVNNPLGSAATSGEMTLMSALSSKGARAETLKGAVKTWARSFGDGVAMMRDLWSTGENLQKISQFDSALVNSPVELLAKMAEDPSFPKKFRGAAKAVSQYKLVMRAMMAADAVIRWPAREALRFTQAAALAKETRKPGQSLEDAVDELNYPGGRQAAVREARAQAAQERADGTLKTKLDERLRVIQLLQSKLSPEGTEAAAESDELANYGSLLNDQPQDFIGVIASALLKVAFPSNTKTDIQKALGGAAQPFVRFVRTSANSTRVMLDYAVGYGAFRYMTRNWPVVGAESLAGGVNLIQGRAGDRLTQVRIQRAYLGIALYAGLAAIYAAIDDDDEDPYIDFIGSGPTTPDERRRVREAGIRLNSIKIGDYYIPTNAGPLQPLAGNFAPFQRMRDNKKWPKAKDEFGERVPEMAGVAAANGIADAMMNQSFTRSLADLLTIFNTGKTSFGEDKWEFAGKNVAQFIPGNLRGLSQLDEIASGKKERADGFFETAANSIAFYAPNGRAVTILGDEVNAGKSVAQKAGEKVFQFTTLADDKTLQFVVRNGLSVPDRQRKSDGRLQTYREYSDYIRKSGKQMRAWMESGGMDALQKLPAERKNSKGRTVYPRKEALNDRWAAFRRNVLVTQ